MTATALVTAVSTQERNVMSETTNTEAVPDDLEPLVAALSDKLDAFAETLSPDERALVAGAFEGADEDEVIGLSAAKLRLSPSFRRAVVIRHGHDFGSINPQPLPPKGDIRSSGGTNIGGTGGPFPR